MASNIPKIPSFNKQTTDTELKKTNKIHKSDGSKSLTLPEDTPHGNKYHLIKTIGKGNFAKVKLAKHLPTGQEVAIKIIDKTQLNSTSLQKLRREVKIMKMLDHPNIVKLYEVIETEKTLNLVMEYASRGELFDYLVANGRMKERDARVTFRQIISAVQYCHQKHILHRDLKAENLLLDEDLNVKIADFGFSNEFTLGTKLDTFCGSPPYAAPELFQGKKYDGPEVDVWSLGVILYTLVSGSLPFDGQNLKELRERVLRGKYRIPFYMSTDCENLLKKFLVLNPLKRTTLDAVLKDHWLNTGFEEERMKPYVEPASMIDESRIDQMVRMGYKRREVEEALVQNSYNHLMATYLLLGKKAHNVDASRRNSDNKHHFSLNHINNNNNNNNINNINNNHNNNNNNATLAATTTTTTTTSSTKTNRIGRSESSNSKSNNHNNNNINARNASKKESQEGIKSQKSPTSATAPSAAAAATTATTTTATTSAAMTTTMMNAINSIDRSKSSINPTHKPNHIPDHLLSNNRASTPATQVNVVNNNLINNKFPRGVHLIQHQQIGDDGSLSLMNASITEESDEMVGGTLVRPTMARTNRKSFLDRLSIKFHRNKSGRRSEGITSVKKTNAMNKQQLNNNNNNNMIIEFQQQQQHDDYSTPPSTMTTTTASNPQNNNNTTNFKSPLLPTTTTTTPTTTFNPNNNSNNNNNNATQNSNPLGGPIKPRALHFTWHMKNTSPADPLKMIVEARRVLDLNQCDFYQINPFVMHCSHGGGAPGDVTFGGGGSHQGVDEGSHVEWVMEVCRLPRLSLNGIKFKRVSGSPLIYKNIAAKISNELKF